MPKTSLIKQALSGYGGQNIQKIGRARRKRTKKRIAAQKKLKGYRKEEAALMKRKKKVNKILSKKSNIMPKYKIKPLKLNSI